MTISTAPNRARLGPCTSCAWWARHTARQEAAAWDGPACLEVAVDAYLAAGGGQHGAACAVRDMIASLSREHGDWLWGPAQAWRDRQQMPEAEPSADADLFEPEYRHA